MKKKLVGFLTLLALTMLMCSVQVSATGLKLLKPKSAAVTMAGASPSAEFTGFRVLKGSERTDWFVIINNTSGVNMARNVYEIRATQTSIAGVTSPAGTPFKLGQDIRSGRTMNLQRQFSPIMDINRITIEVIDTRSNRSIGSGTFSATAAAPAGPGTVQAGTSGNTAAGASNAAVNLVRIDPDQNKLQLIIKEQANGGVDLTAKNVGTAVIDLAGYEFSLSGHLLLRPTEMETRDNITGDLQPGASKNIPSGKRFASACANFTHYTATARNKTTSQQYEARLDVPPLSVSMKAISLELRSAKLSDLSVVTVVLEVTNTSNRIVRSFAATGQARVKTDRGTYIIPFNVNTGEIIAPGAKRIVKFDISIGSPSDQDMLFYEKTDLTFHKAKHIEVMVRLENPVDCGVPVILTPYKHVVWPAL